MEEFIRMAGRVTLKARRLTVRDRLVYARDQVESTFRKVFPYILAGVGIGAVIHNWIPEAWIETALGSGNPFGVVLAVLVGVPMYADIFGTIPGGRGAFGQGRPAGDHLKLHDGGHNLELSVYGHAGKGGEAAAPGNICGGLYRGDHFCGL